MATWNVTFRGQPCPDREDTLRASTSVALFAIPVETIAKPHRSIDGTARQFEPPSLALEGRSSSSTEAALRSVRSDDHSARLLMSTPQTRACSAEMLRLLKPLLHA
jgi:hypothetical protein